jgi:predicted amidohydrolase YtcJ
VADADLILRNGRIYTVDSDSGIVEALAVADGKVLAVGTNSEIDRLRDRDTTVIDLVGRFAMPGFNDAHVHLGNAALRTLNVDLSGTTSLEDLKDRLRTALPGRSKGDWVYGRGWDESKWADARIPHRADLDSVTTEHALFLERADGHSSVLNSLALERAGIGPYTPDPAGGVIERDAEGQPTGWLKEKAADKVFAMIPEPTPDQWRDGFLRAMRHALENGVTSVQDDTLRSPGQGETAVTALKQLREKQTLPLRVTVWLPFEAPLAELEQWRESLGTTDRWLKAGLLKTNIDGSGGSLSAAMLEPYASAPDNKGLLLLDADTLMQMVIERDAAGFQIGIHAIGDRANRVVLDAFAAAIDRNGRRDSRHRVEHAQFVSAADLDRFGSLGVIASVQPSHLLTDLRWAPTLLGRERETDAYRWKSFIDSGAHVCFGTDYPVEPIDPMRGLYAAVTREFETGGPRGGWHPEESLDVATAIAAYTLQPAFAEFEETRKGSLSVGKLADIVVLSSDPIAVSPRALLDTRVDITIVEGNVVYRRN